MTGLFLGAGASYEVGMPLVDELSNSIRQNVLKRLDTKLFDFENEQDLRVELCSVLEKYSGNYEEVLSHFENLYNTEIINSEKIWRLIIQFIECIQLILLEDQYNTLSLFKEKIKDYKGIKKLFSARDTPLEVFSLNHDVVFEEIFSYYNIPFRDGFFDKDNTYKSLANFKVLTQENIKNSNLNFYGKNERGVNFLKLHGSVDMFSTEDNGIFLKSQGVTNTFSSHLSEVKKIEDHALSVSRIDEIRVVNELNVFDDNKEIQFLRRSLLSGGNKFKDRKRQIVPIEFLRVFKNRLNYIEKLTVIGYGFGDTHINDIFLAWMGTGKRMMEIYDPCKEEIPSFLQNHADQVAIVKTGLTGYFSNFDMPDNPLDQSIRDQLREKRLNYRWSEERA